METLYQQQQQRSKAYYVLILPMRNGNRNSSILNSLCSFWVLILPMRNGNQFPWFPFLIPSFVLILPMRNGNSLSVAMLQNLQAGSYPTYEEWKLRKIYNYNVHTSTSSYPTYEEWKRFLKLILDLFFPRSYPTYEEWKQREIRDYLMKMKVLILPMRNGNYHKQKNNNPSPQVLILPMRNGNMSFVFYNNYHFPRSYPTYEEWKLIYVQVRIFFMFVFLSYLWGMETTRSCIFYSFMLDLFLSYLWGMETIFQQFSEYGWVGFLSYLWGMETIKKK